jgi:hypothetical protein
MIDKANILLRVHNQLSIAAQINLSVDFCIFFSGKSFGRLHNLQGHMHMHEDSKPFVCFCGSSFTLRGEY